jgi:hypothetical protein
MIIIPLFYGFEDAFMSLYGPFVHELLQGVGNSFYLRSVVIVVTGKAYHGESGKAVSL